VARRVDEDSASVRTKYHTRHLQPGELEDPDRKRDYNRRLFAVVAPRYEVATRALSCFRDRSWKRELVAIVPPDFRGTVLDLATGNGDLAFRVHRRCPEAWAVGADLSAEMMRLVDRRTTGTWLAFTRQDMCALSIKTSSVDLVTAGYALRNAPHLDLAIGEIARVLKPGGVALFLEFTRSARPVPASVQCGLLRLWGGLWGLLLHGHPSVYAYLGASLAAFPPRQGLHAMLARHGLRVRRSRVRMFGLIEILQVARDQA
jgi:demethylmenaquinone methyltransferase/2-methoxy-6-polyprenyl-1,4-benzoquinol methylase